MSALTGDHHDPSPLTEPRAAGGVRPGPAMPPLDGSRPFGIHYRMAWWKSLFVIVALPLTLVVTQLAFYLLAGLAEGRDPFAQDLSPLKLLGANLSTGVTALVALVLVGRFAKVPWRFVFSAPRRFDRRRLLMYFLGSLAIVGVAFALVGLTAAGAVGWTTLTVTSTTIGILVVVILSTPIQTAGEEIILRGAILPAAGSWFRSIKPAFLTGLVVSSLMFAFLHGSTDPMLFAYYLVFSVATAVMGLLTRGLEAAIAFHTANNLVVTTINALFAGGGVVAVERSEGAAGGLALLIPAAASLAALTMVWLRERRRRS
ncbi:type II CAAX endopeptidase family protein [Microbacterium sp. LMC-P-041]|uniref:CPBP family intramembrane glutamic endopeptidase n=1 Tax=Microbacterium sp. LMC-P-041 TaxID=3040293 RepID=UPI002552B63C|nr:type II CAAX endopeptidase family protein [Microbacterium sp. LMC-P-041]